MDQGRFGDAALPVERAASILGATSAETHFSRIAANMNLASLRLETGKVAEAEDLYRFGLALIEQQLGDQHAATARARSLLAQALQRNNQMAEAQTNFRAALDVQRQSAPAQLLATTLIGLGGSLRDQGQFAAAEPLLREGVEKREAELPTGHWQVAHARSELAGCLLRMGRYDEAATLLPEATSILETLLDNENYRVRQARLWLAEFQAAPR